jgi:hypothetical protein
MGLCTDAGRRGLADNKKVKNGKMLLANLQLHVVVNVPINFIRKYEYGRGKTEKSIHLQDKV